LGISRDLAEKTVQWAIAKDDGLSSRFVRDGMHFVSDMNPLDSKIVVIGNMLKGYLFRLPRLLWCLVLIVRP